VAASHGADSRTLKDDQDRPLPGVTVESHDNQYLGIGVTDTSGYYVVGVRAGNWWNPPERGRARRPGLSRRARGSIWMLGKR